MPLPLLWLGAATVSALAVNELVQDRKSQQKLRHQKLRTLSEQGSNLEHVAIYPSSVFATEQSVLPKPGAIVCCGIAGVLEHTGIWVGDNTIVELSGSGLVKAVSPQRFLDNRSGGEIFIAADSKGQALADNDAASRAVQEIYQFYDYDLLDNNCHHFVWQCYQPQSDNLTTFDRLNTNIAQYFDRVVYWDKCQI